MHINIVYCHCTTEPHKHINIDLLKAKLIFVLTHDVAVDVGVKLARSTSKILLYEYVSPLAHSLQKHCLRLLDWYLEALGSNTLPSKNAFWPVFQKLLALTSNLASSFVFDFDGTRLLFVTGCRICSMATLRQTSSNNAPLLSLMTKGHKTSLLTRHCMLCTLKDTVFVNLL